MKMEFGNIFKSSGMEGAKLAASSKLVASSKPGDTDNLQVGDNFMRSEKKEKKDSLFKDRDQILIDKIIIAKGELSDILNRKPLVKSDREEASAKRDAIKSLEKDLEDYKKTQQN